MKAIISRTVLLNAISAKTDQMTSGGELHEVSMSQGESSLFIGTTEIDCHVLKDAKMAINNLQLIRMQNVLSAISEQPITLTVDRNGSFVLLEIMI